MATVLFVCTGNLCRSPSAEWFLTRRISADGPAHVSVASAGTMQAAGGPPEKLLAEGAAFGLTLEHHRPRRMERGDVAEAKLIIGMTRQHAREAVLLDPAAFSRTFVLREFVRRGTEVGRRSARLALADWLTELHGARRHMDLVGEQTEDDIPDPIGGPAAGFRAMLDEVSALVDQLYALTWGAASSPNGAPPAGVSAPRPSEA